jgi:beta-lactam-binding protein with PASTA domain
MLAKLSIVLALAGCKMMGGVATTTTTSPGVASSAGDSSVSGKHAVPDVRGKTIEEARAAWTAAGFSGDVDPNRPRSCGNAPETAGKITCQSPEPGEQASAYAMLEVIVYTPQVFEGQLVRSQMSSLKGQTIEQAKASLKKMGHDGSIVFEESRSFLKDCGEGIVCGTRNSSGIGIHDEITLVINKQVTIAAPPPD